MLLLEDKLCNEFKLLASAVAKSMRKPVNDFLIVPQSLTVRERKDRTVADFTHLTAI